MTRGIRARRISRTKWQRDGGLGVNSSNSRPLALEKRRKLLESRLSALPGCCQGVTFFPIELPELVRLTQQRPDAGCVGSEVSVAVRSRNPGWLPFGSPPQVAEVRRSAETRL